MVISSVSHYAHPWVWPDFQVKNYIRETAASFGAFFGLKGINGVYPKVRQIYALAFAFSLQFIGELKVGGLAGSYRIAEKLFYLIVGYGWEFGIAITDRRRNDIPQVINFQPQEVGLQVKETVNLGADIS